MKLALGSMRFVWTQDKYSGIRQFSTKHYFYGTDSYYEAILLEACVLWIVDIEAEWRKYAPLN